MDETYLIKAIILKRQPFREYDAKVTVYSLEQGKMELVARGVKKISSKLAAHIEPISLTNIMVIKGKQFNYIGSSVSENNFLAVRSNLEKIKVTGKAINIFDKLIKPERQDKELFQLLYIFLEILNEKKIDYSYDLFLYYLILKILTELGYKPELHVCVTCKKKIKPTGNSFDLLKGGIICVSCKKTKNSLTISDNAIKILRLTIEENLEELIKLKIEIKLEKEIIKIISSFLQFHM